MASADQRDKMYTSFEEYGHRVAEDELQCGEVWSTLLEEDCGRQSGTTLVGHHAMKHLYITHA